MFGNVIIIYKEARLVQYSRFYPEGRHTSNSNYDSLFGGSNYDSLFVRTVAFPVQVAYWIKEVIAPCGYSVPCQL